MINTAQQIAVNENLITHNTYNSDFRLVYEAIRQRLIAGGDSPYASLDEKLDILEQMTQVDLGRFVLEHRGLNGYWSDYIIRNAHKTELSKMELFFLQKFPLTLALRERLKVSQELLQQNLLENIALASLPCGVMADLLTLDYKSYKKVNITGIDLDFESLTLSHALAVKNKLELETQFIQADAWSIEFKDKYHMVVSNGLNNYVTNIDRLVSLYGKLREAIKPGGILITSFRTPSPEQNKHSPWNMDIINPEHLRLQKIVFDDIIQARWHSTQTVDEMADILERAGFNKLELIFDQAKLSPTVIAQK